MPLSTQFTLSLELAKMLPVREALSSGAESIISFARALRRSGSDFLVEEDLAAIFGRGRIESSIEKKFRDALKEVSFTPLHEGSQISLDATPGPTVGRALKDRYYMASVIQLSFLVWMNEEITLASALVECMRTRYHSGVEGATPDPDYDGILKTLHACSSQTSQFHWDDFIALVESKFPVSRHWFRESPNPLRFISPNLLLGAMDYFYLVQSLPEDRLVMVESQISLVPTVIWAHFLLGLTVLVKDSPDGDIIFGGRDNPQIIIKWSLTSLRAPPSTNVSRGGESSMPRWAPAPTIYLLDGSLDILLKSEPNDNEGAKIEGQESHRLQGYGTTFLRRRFNSKMLIADDDPIYFEAANYALAFTTVLARSIRRVPFPHPYELEKNCQVPEQCYLSTEQWQFWKSGKLLFAGIKLDERTINDYVQRLAGLDITNTVLPSGIRNFVEKFPYYTFDLRKAAFIEDTKLAASWILTFAQVINIEAYADLPLYFHADGFPIKGLTSWNGLGPLDIDSDIWFNYALRMMKNNVREEDPNTESDEVFLTSHRGWSLFYSTVDDRDPGKLNCETLRIERGVPTNRKTGERKYRIADAPCVEQGLRTPNLVDNGSSYLPRCITKVYKRTEYYSSRASEFWLSIRFDVEEQVFSARDVAQQRLTPREKIRYSVYASHSKFHDALGGIVKSTPCHHPDNDGKTLPLDLGTVTAAGLTWAYGSGMAGHSRICICLVKGDARARWLVVNGILPSLSMESPALDRKVLLRCDGCCEDCVVKAAAAMEGDWLVVL